MSCHYFESVRYIVYLDNCMEWWAVLLNLPSLPVVKRDQSMYLNLFVYMKQITIPIELFFYSNHAYDVFWKNAEYFFSSWSNSKFRIAFWIEFKSWVGDAEDVEGESLFSFITMVCCLFLGDVLKGKIWAKWQSCPALQLPWLKNRQDAGNRFVVVYMRKAR